jgi:hypothetical protein
VTLPQLRLLEPFNGPHYDAPSHALAQVRRRVFLGHQDGLVRVRFLDDESPPVCSFVSTKGPSVIETLPFLGRTVVANRVG